MKLEQALSYGRRVRRESQASRPWYTRGELAVLDLTDALADDWEVEPPMYLVTREQLLSIYEFGRISAFALGSDIADLAMVGSRYRPRKTLDDLIAELEVYNEG